MTDQLKEISRAYSGFCFVSDENKKEIPATNIIEFDFEETFVNMVNHVRLRFGEQGNVWLRLMAKEWID